MSEKRVGVGFGVMVLKDNKVLLGKRHDDPEKADSLLDGAGKWTMPGGKLEFGEKLEDGAKRELLEETGLVAGRVEVMYLNQDIIESAHFITIGLLCDDFSGDLQVMEPDEITEWKWFELSNLPEPLYFPTAKVFENYRQNKFFIPES